LCADVNAHWPGTDDELRRLISAIERNCACSTLDQSEPNVRCGPHGMLADQHVLNHLVYAVRMHGRLRLEEWSAPVYRRVSYAILASQADNT